MIVISPTHDWLAAARKTCNTSIKIASPYIGAYLNKQIDKLSGKVNVTLLTRTSLADFASRASDLEAVLKVAHRSGGILSLSSLHAKVYIVDDALALVTSANATFSGMHRNHECGFQVTEPSAIATLSALIVSGFGATHRPRLWTIDDLLELREPVKALRAALPKKPKIKDLELATASKIELSQKQLNQLLETLPAWTRLTVEGITTIHAEVFTMDSVWAACQPLAAIRFPNNRHVREKLRQQLQVLRDMGFVLFLGGGRYQSLTYTR